MALIVQKFGGTSVGTVERIEQVAEKVKKFREAGDDIVVVVSAMSGETNRLIGLAKQIMEQPVPRELDVMVSTGEQVTIALLSMALIKRGVPAVSYTGNQVRILTDSAHTKARILSIDYSEAEQAEGVHSVITHQDVPGLNAHGRTVPDQPVFCHDYVRFTGDPIALVLADSREQVRSVAGYVQALRDFWIADTDLRSALTGRSPGAVVAPSSPEPSSATPPAADH